MPPTESSPRQGPLPHDGPPTRSRREGLRVVAIAFAISLVVHVLAVLLYPVLLDRTATDLGEPDAPEPEPPEIVLLELEEPEEADEPEDEPEEDEEAVPEPVPPEVPPPEPVEEEPEVEPGEVPAEPVEPEEDERLSAAERLRPRFGPDPGLWTFADPEALELTPDERAELRIRAAVRAVGDSLTAEEERRLESLDWTYTDDDGEKWGVSPGQIHLGDRTIPVPFAFTPAPGRQEDLSQLEQELWEFGPAQSLQEAREIIEERIEAIRERRNAERADSTRYRP